MVDEFRYVKDKLSNGMRDEANRLKYFRRYRDDCTNLNCDDFIKIAGEMYPPSLSLTQENEDPSKAKVLDMEVNISGNQCKTKIFCKTDHFPFDVISFPFLESNIDGDLCYRVFYSQIIQFQRLCSDKSDFELRTKHLGSILKSRGYNLSQLRKEFCKAIIKYVREFQKWAIPFNLNNWFRQIFNEQPQQQGQVPMSLTQPSEDSSIQRGNHIHMSQP